MNTITKKLLEDEIDALKLSLGMLQGEKTGTFTMTEIERMLEDIKRLKRNVKDLEEDYNKLKEIK